MTWLFTAWLCAAFGSECRPIEAPYASRGACLHAERVLREQGQTAVRTVHCHHVRDMPVS